MNKWNKRVYLLERSEKKEKTGGEEEEEERECIA